MRLTHIDSTNKNKAIIDVIWSHLSGNDHPYLSVDIKQVMIKGKRINGWKEQKEALQQLDQDFYFLANQHLKSDQGEDMHMIADSVYWCNEFLKSLGGESVTNQLQDLSRKTGLTVDQLKSVLFSDDIEKEITPLLKDQAMLVNDQLKQLTEQYSINLVKR